MIHNVLYFVLIVLKALQSKNIIVFEKNLSLTQENKKFKPHTDFSDLVKFKNDSYYLFKEAAIFDTEFPLRCVEYFRRNKNFVQMSNPDFSRTVLLEAATIITHISNDLQNIIGEESSDLKVNQLHLVGGGSLPGFLGFITKMAIFSSNLPLKLISSGRQYNITKNNLLRNDLYTANQTNVVQIFCVTKNENESQEEMDSILNSLKEIYDKLDVKFRIKYSKAYEMLPAEILSARVQIFSPVHSKYIDIGYVSNYSDFISKRLLFSIREKKSVTFPHIVSGTIVDTIKIIACLLENQRNLLTPLNLI